MVAPRPAFAAEIPMPQVMPDRTPSSADALNKLAKKYPTPARTTHRRTPNPMIAIEEPGLACIRFMCVMCLSRAQRSSSLLEDRLWNPWSSRSRAAGTEGHPLRAPVEGQGEEMHHGVLKFTGHLPSQLTAILRDRHITHIGQLVAESQYDLRVLQPIGAQAEPIGRANREAGFLNRVEAYCARAAQPAPASATSSFRFPSRIARRLRTPPSAPSSRENKPDEPKRQSYPVIWPGDSLRMPWRLPC